MLALRRRMFWLWNAIIRLLSWVYRRRQRRRLLRLGQAVKPVIRSLRESRVRQRQPATTLGGWSDEPLCQRQLLDGIGTGSISSVHGEQDTCIELHVAISDDADAGYRACIGRRLDPDATVANPAWIAALSGKGRLRLAGVPPAMEGMTLAWFESQGQPWPMHVAASIRRHDRIPPPRGGR